ncbi:unnamed protein product [Cylicocyclus nassatus]|uniref:Uncharacterized protein n=1 Tax=Cylicocyclus nassatus TaxID=53992 RepID=A0AA36DIM3_CYLNA|nr:unnamed protein product [Cylicocyclus nassatus]
MLVILLSALVSTTLAAEYANPSLVAPAPAAYGSPYASNSVIVPQPSVQFQSYPSHVAQHPVALPVQTTQAVQNAYPYGYGMFGALPTVQQNPYQMYQHQTTVKEALPTTNLASMYVNYPQTMETVGGTVGTSSLRQSQQTSIPASSVSSGSSYFSLPASTTSTEYVAPATASATIKEIGAVHTLPTQVAATTVTDPWAALSGVTTKKTVEVKKNDGGGSSTF